MQKKREAEKKAVAQAVSQVIQNPDLDDKQRLFACLWHTKETLQQHIQNHTNSYQSTMANGIKMLKNDKGQTDGSAAVDSSFQLG